MNFFDPKSLIFIFLLIFSANALAMEKKPNDGDMLCGIVFDTGESCSICFVDYEKNSLIAMFSCGHFICAECAVKLDRPCPTCGQSNKIFYLEFESVNNKITPQLLQWKMTDGDEEQTLKMLERCVELKNSEKLSQDEFLTILNTVDFDGQAPLHKAVMNNWEKVVLFLVAAKADINVRDRHKLSPYERAVELNLSALKKLLKPEIGPRFFLKKVQSSWKFSATKKVWGCHHYQWSGSPARRNNKNNIYTEGSACAKYDLLYNTRSAAYEIEQDEINKKTKNIYFFGSSEVAVVACIFDPPNRSVIKKNNGKIAHFSVEDVSNLLVKVVPHLVYNIDFLGRFVSDISSAKDDLTPEIFLKVLKEWDKEKRPLVLDFFSVGRAFSLPSDEIVIAEFAEETDSGIIKYYRAIVFDAGQNERSFSFFIQYNHDLQFVKSSWLKGKGDDFPPHSMWRPHARKDLTKKPNWKSSYPFANPYIDPQVVFEIYTKSKRLKTVTECGEKSWSKHGSL